MAELELLQTDTQDVKLRKVVEFFSYEIKELKKDIALMQESIVALQSLDLTENVQLTTKPDKFIRAESYIYRLNTEFNMDFTYTDLSFALCNLGYLVRVAVNGKKHTYKLSDKATPNVMRLGAGSDRLGIVKRLMISERVYDNEILPYFKQRFSNAESITGS